MLMFVSHPIVMAHHITDSRLMMFALQKIQRYYGTNDSIRRQNPKSAISDRAFPPPPPPPPPTIIIMIVSVVYYAIQYIH